MKVRALVVDDNPGDVELLRMALKEAALDCELIVIDDGGEALNFLLGKEEHAGALVPDIVILDLNVPKIDGLEILGAMRADPRSAKVPVAVLSSSSSARDRAKMESFGAGLYITKPSDLDEYLQIGFQLKKLLGES